MQNARRGRLAGRTIAYTGDTAWTDAITEAAYGADLLIAEAYYRDERVPRHLRLADLDARRHEITARRVIVAHMSADVLAVAPGTDGTPFERAHDGLSVRL